VKREKYSQMDHNGNTEVLINAEESTETGNENHSPVFTAFMQDMISRHKIKRTDISRITGISQDYLYKILNGTKHTAQRDYIIAICCAIGMNAEETKHALDINGMSILKEDDPRDRVILEALNDTVSLYKLNDRLEKAGYPWLKFSKYMEEYIPD
jgi:predicted transcriptional regulator